MEFWLIKDSNEKLQLPVPPAKYSIKGSVNSSTVNVLGLGEVSFSGTSKLFEIPAIESFFPNQNYSFCQYTGFPAPDECVEMLNKWMDDNTVLRYIVTDKLNMECTIDSFEPGEEDGTGDIYFVLQLKEYRRIGNISKTGWISSGSSWYYFNDDGTKKTGWLQDGGKWYYLKENGAMQIGWLYDGGKWYYLNSNGSMASSQWVIWNGKQYYVYSNGAMAVNTYIDGWYVGSDGAWDGKAQV